MSIETVAVAGGSGKIGREILDVLDGEGYRTVNLDRHPTEDRRADEFVRVDLLDAGQVASAFSQWDADAVIHMATVTSPNHDPGHVTFESNAMSTYHVLEAATELGLEAVVLPSSINVMGADFQSAPTDVRYLPVDEDHPLTPRDPYALGKQTTEALGDGFGRRPDAPQVASLRYPWVATDERLRERIVETDRSLDAVRQRGRSTLFSYLHVADAATIARRAVETDFDGHEAFWAVAADTNVDPPSERLAAECYPDAEVRGSLDGNESLISTDKARELLGWEPERSWREY